jgi:NAD(P)-dependent dehydrogenase (short-subunit alcohol dehydrogenase family)
VLQSRFAHACAMCLDCVNTTLLAYCAEDKVHNSYNRASRRSVYEILQRMPMIWLASLLLTHCTCCYLKLAQHWSYTYTQIGWGNSVYDTVNTNYFGVRRVNDAFMPLLSKSNSRIVNVASAAGPNFIQSCSNPTLKAQLAQPWTIQGGIPELDDLAKSIRDGQRKESDNFYGISKALLNAYTALFGKSQSDIVVNACTPGYILTDLTSGYGGATKSPAEGAVPPCWLMMEFDGKPGATAGRYYGSDCVRSPLDVYRDPGSAAYTSTDDEVDLKAIVESMQE